MTRNFLWKTSTLRNKPQYRSTWKYYSSNKKKNIGVELTRAQIILFYFYKHIKNTHNHYCAKYVFLAIILTTNEKFYILLKLTKNGVRCCFIGTFTLKKKMKKVFHSIPYLFI